MKVKTLLQGSLFEEVSATSADDHRFSLNWQKLFHRAMR